MSQLIENAVSGIVKDILEDYKGNKAIDSMKDVFTQLDKDVIIDLVNKLLKIIYPGYFRDTHYKIYDTENHFSLLIEDAMYNMNKQIALGLSFKPECANLSQDEISEESQKITIAFFKQIPKIRYYVETSVNALFDGDPATSSRDEIIFAYPGLLAIAVYRMAHELFLLKVPLIPRIMSEYVHDKTGVDIHPGATIGEYFFIDHATGIVIGETTVIGKNVKIYQGVTLGALSTKGGQKLNGVRRHPTIEDNVTIYAGASILGGNTVIGEGSTIGSNVFITSSIPAHTKVSIKTQELVMRSGKKETEENQDQSWNDTSCLKID